MFICGNPDIFTFFKFKMLEKHVNNAIFVMKNTELEFCRNMSKDNCEKYPLISIGVSAYNRKEYLKLCLDSLLAQTYPNLEIIVVDDGSTDGTPEMMAECYPDIRCVRQEKSGDAAAKNHAARIASGEYILFDDSDDLLYPDSVMRLYQAMPPSGDCCSYGTYQLINAEGKELVTRRKMKRYPSGRILRYLLSHVIVNSRGVLIPRHLFSDTGGFDTALNVMHYYRFFLELSLKCEFYPVQKPVFMRRHYEKSSLTSGYEKMSATNKVFEDFVESHPELRHHYAKIISRRRYDIQKRLYSEARYGKLKKQAAMHAKEAFRLKPGFKSFFRMITSAVLAK